MSNFVEKYVKGFLKKHALLRKKARVLNTYVKKKWYISISKKHNIDNHKVLFETFMGRQYGCNPRAIYEYMISDDRFKNYKFVWAFENPDDKKSFTELERAETVKYKSKDYYRAYASAKYIITNSNIDYHIVKKKGQVFMQTWHGTPLKKLRCDIEAEYGNVNNTLDEIKMKNALDVVRYDYFLSPSRFASEKFKSAFNLRQLKKENIIVETGYPRNDLMFNYTDVEIEKILNELGIKTDKKILLYAPTYRDNQHESGKGYVYNLYLDFDRMYKEIGDQYIILFRAHYFIANQFDFEKYKGFVYNVSDLDDITKLYLITDVLVTDYSSVFFDYANLKRPMIFYMYDLDEYEREIRGFYIDLNELPGPIVKSENELIESIKSINSEFLHNEKYDKFNKKYNYLDDGEASKRVSELIIDNRSDTDEI